MSVAVLKYNAGNVRSVSIALTRLGVEHEITDDHDQIRGNPRSGWAYVLTIRDLGALTGISTRDVSNDLVNTWQQNWSRLEQNDESAENISIAIDNVRNNVLEVLVSLD